jgi:hypothetical protein
MNRDEIFQDIDTLPPDAQQQVIDFIAFLQTRYQRSGRKKSRSASFASESFLGVWRDREDMANSTDWVRQVRKSEWNNPG